MTESAQPTLRWQLHLPRCCNSRAGVRIRGIFKPNRKHAIPNLERTTIALSFYIAFTADNAPAGRHAAMLLIHTSAPQDWKCYCHTGWATDVPLAASICFTFAARARGLNCAPRCNAVLLFASKFRAFRFESKVSIQTPTSVLPIIFRQEFDPACGSCCQGCGGSAVCIQVNSLLPWMRSPRSNMN